MSRNWLWMMATALQADLTRGERVKALEGHGKVATGLVGTFSKP